jgi:hypothetical protein
LPANEGCLWRPLPDSNRNRRFRKPELYPVELRGRAAM